MVSWPSCNKLLQYPQCRHLSSVVNNKRLKHPVVNGKWSITTALDDPSVCEVYSCWSIRCCWPLVTAARILGHASAVCLCNSPCSLWKSWLTEICMHFFSFENLWQTHSHETSYLWFSASGPQCSAALSLRTLAVICVPSTTLDHSCSLSLHPHGSFYRSAHCQMAKSHPVTHEHEQESFTEHCHLYIWPQIKTSAEAFE